MALKKPGGRGREGKVYRPLSSLMAAPRPFSSPRLKFLNGSASLLEEDPVPAIRAADINVDLNLLLAPGALV